MDQKRELTSVDIAALAVELDDYAGARFEKAYRYPDDLLRVRLRDHDRGRVELLVDVGATKHVRVADPEHVPDAPERPPDFAMMLRNRLEGATFVGAEQFEFDRILELRFEREGDSTTVVAELFGDGNVAVLDAAGDVIDCYETVRLKSRTVAPGAPYAFPDARFDPLGVSAKTFAARMRESDSDLVRTLATQMNFGGRWAEELCTRAEVSKTLAIDAAGEAEFDALYRVASALAGRLRAGDFDPHLYTDPADGDRPVDVTPVPLEELVALDGDRFQTFTAALDAYFTGLATEEVADAGRERPDFEAQIERQHRIIEQQEAAIESFEEEAAAKRAAAEALYARYDLVDEILTTIRDARAADRDWDEIAATLETGADRGIPAAEAVVDVDGSTGTVTVDLEAHRVTLEVGMGVEKNADRLYREAKAVAEKKEGAEAAIVETRAELADVEQRRETWGAGGEEDDTGDADAVAAEPEDWLARDSIPVRRGEDWYEGFRWFHTTEDFLVIGGRNADQNEELVKKYLERGDRFFHAQAHGGPVTILKATGPSESTRDVGDLPAASRDQAARFAVSYSSVWKDGKYAGDAYEVGPDQVSKTPESGEFLEKGGFAIRGERTYHEDLPTTVAVGVTCEPETRVIGGPPAAIEPAAVTSVTLEPGRFAQNDAAKKVYRTLKERFADDAFVRKVASPDLLQEFLPPGGSRIVEE